MHAEDDLVISPEYTGGPATQDAWEASRLRARAAVGGLWEAARARARARESSIRRGSGALGNIVTEARAGIDDAALVPLVFGALAGLDTADQIASFRQSQRQRGISPAMADFQEAEGLGETLLTGLRVAPEVVARSVTGYFPVATPTALAGGQAGAVAGGAVGGPGGAVIGGAIGSAAGVGAGSGLLSTAQKFLELLDDQGVDTADPRALRAALANDAIWLPAAKTAGLSAIPTAVMDGLTAGLAGKFAPIARRLGPQGAGRVAAGVRAGLGGAAEVAVQGAGGAAGSVGSNVIIGEPIDTKSAVLEALAEVGTVPGDISLNALNAVRGRGVTEGVGGAGRIQGGLDTTASGAPAPLPVQTDPGLVPTAGQAGNKGVAEEARVEGYQAALEDLGISPRDARAATPATTTTPTPAAGDPINAALGLQRPTALAERPLSANATPTGLAEESTLPDPTPADPALDVLTRVAATSDQHARLVNDLAGLVDRGGATREGAALFAATIEDAAPELVGSVRFGVDDVADEANTARAGRYEPAQGRAAARIIVNRRLAELSAEPGAAPELEPAVILAHEWGHHTARLLAPQDRAVVEDVWRTHGRTHWRRWFRRGLSDGEGADYAVSSPDEFLAAAYADYAVSGAVADQRLAPLLQRLWEAFQRAAGRLVSKGRRSSQPGGWDRLQPILEAMRTGRGLDLLDPARGGESRGGPSDGLPGLAPTSSAPVTLATPTATATPTPTPTGATRAGLLELADGRSLPVTYDLVEADAIIPSHDARRGFARNPGADINERPYEDPQAGAPSRRTVQAIAADPKPALLLSDTPSPIDGPPIVDAEGRVLGGNARTMALQMVYAEPSGEPARRVRAALAERAGRFGFTPEQVQSMRAPVLVRRLRAEDAGGPGDLSRVLNQGLTSARTAAADSVSRAAKITPETAERIGELVGDDSLAAALGDHRGAKIVRRLIEDGALAQADADALLRAGELTREGKAVVERTLLGRLLSDVGTVSETPASVANTLIRALGPLLRIQAAARAGDGLAFDAILSDAIRALRFTRANGMETVAFARDNALDPPAFLRDPRAVALAGLIQAEKPTAFAARMRGLADAMQEAASGQIDLSGRAATPSERLDEGLGVADRPAGPFGRPVDEAAAGGAMRRRRLAREAAALSRAAEGGGESRAARQGRLFDQFVPSALQLDEERAARARTRESDRDKETGFLFGRPLPGQQPVVLRGDELGTSDDPAELRRAARQWITRELAEPRSIPSTDGGAIVLARRGVINAMFHGAGPDKLRAVVALPDLLARARFVGSKPDRDNRPEIAEVRAYEHPITIGGRRFMARLIVRVTNEGRRFYDHGLSSIKETPAGKFGGSVGADRSPTQPAAGVPEESIDQDPPTVNPTSPPSSSNPAESPPAGPARPEDSGPDSPSPNFARPIKFRRLPPPVAGDVRPQQATPGEASDVNKQTEAPGVKLAPLSPPVIEAADAVVAHIASQPGNDRLKRKLGAGPVDRLASGVLTGTARRVQQTFDAGLAAVIGREPLEVAKQVIATNVLDPLLPLQVTVPEAVSIMREQRTADAFGRKLSGELLRIFSKGGDSPLLGLSVRPSSISPANLQAVFRALNGEASLESVPETGGLRDAAGKAIELVDALRRQMRDEGLMSESVYKAYERSYVPYLYRKHEIERASVLRSAVNRLTKGHGKPRVSDKYTIYRKDTLVFNPDGTAGWFDARERDAHVERLADEEFLKVINGGRWDPQARTLNAMVQQGRRLTLADLTPDGAVAALPAAEKVIVDRLRTSIRGEFTTRDPLTDSEFRQKGRIEDPGYLLAHAVASANHDLQMMRMFRRIDQRQEWVADQATPGFRKLDDTPRLGPLAGRWVVAPLHNELAQLANSDGLSIQIFDYAMRLWKTGKTVYNPATHVRNAISNTIFADLANVNPVNPLHWPLYARAWRLLVSGGGAGVDVGTLRVMERLGVVGQGEAAVELRSKMRTLLDASDLEKQGVLRSLVTLARRGHDALVNVYQGTDDLFKAAAWLKAKDEGMSDADASALVRTWFPYYDQVPSSKALKITRRLALPFVSFMYEASRIGLAAIRHRPVTMAKWLLLPTAISALSAWSLGLSDEDRELVDKQRKKTLGWPLFSALMPFRDANNRLVQYDLSNVVPWANMLGGRVENPDAGQDDVSRLAATILTGNPALQITAALAFNRDPYFGRRIVDSDMSPAEVRDARLKYLANTLLPPLIGRDAVEAAFSGGRSPGPTVFNPGQVQRGQLAKRDTTQMYLRTLAGIDLRDASPRLGPLIEDWLSANNRPEQPVMDDNNAAGRARGRLYQAVLDKDTQRIGEELGRLKALGVPVKSSDEMRDLIDARHPLSKLRTADRRRFVGSLPTEARATVERIVAEHQQVLRGAGRLWREGRGR